MDVQPFTVEVPEAALEDLRERLALTRWPDEIPGSGWDYGSNLAYIQELVEYWRTQFDWRAQEKAMNTFAQYRATVDGLGIHFIHERGKGPDPLPLIITHGWPKTFFEMYKIIPLLTDPASHGADPADSFDVVVPSGPGFGFSDRPKEPGMHYWRIADLWAKLMTDALGYQRFAAQGGDWGASVTARLGYSYPERVIGIHVTLVGGSAAQPYLGPGSRELSDREQAFVEERLRWRDAEGGYSHIQGTKPQTLGYGLNDSPAGLAAWIVEKFRTWSDCDGDVERRFTKDELLTNVSIYWLTETINSANHLYYESQRIPWNLEQGERVEVPCGVAIFAKEIMKPPREYAERSFNVQRWSEMPGGGHFNAMEEPDMLVEDIRAFFRPLRNSSL